MQADDRRRFTFIKVTEDSFSDIDAQLLQSIRLGNNRVAKGARDEAAVDLVFDHVKDNFARNAFRMLQQRGVGFLFNHHARLRLHP